MSLKAFMIPSVNIHQFSVHLQHDGGKGLMRRKGKQKWTRLRAEETCEIRACSLFWISFSATPWAKPLLHLVLNQVPVTTVLLGRTQPLAPELVYSLLRMLQILFLLGWGRKWQKCFVKAVEGLELCFWQSSVPSLLGVWEQNPHTSQEGQMATPGTPTEASLGSLKNAFLENSFAMN